MQGASGQQDEQRSGTVSGEFLIPDLCSPRAVFIMVLLAELLVLVYTLASSSLPRFNWDLLAICSLFVQWVVLLSAALLCPLRKAFAGMSLHWASICCLAVVMTVTGLSSIAAMYLYPQLIFGAEGPWWLARNLLIALVLAGIALRHFYLQQQLKLRERSELLARLDSLRARIRPHFLFNTMNSIASLIASHPDRAEQAVEDLSELFRSSLQEQDERTTVADEIRLCELYLGIEKLRLGERLAVSWDIDNSLSNVAMPGLLLQPLIENAVYHGIAQLPAGGTIKVALGRQDGQIAVCIENPIPDAPGHSDGHHMALVNIEQRLHGLYGIDAGVLGRQEGRSYRVDLHYPLGEAI